jgi:hypothetical protein
MKQLFFSIAAFCCVLYTGAQNIVAAEYFINTDPGAGNGIAITIPTPGGIVNFSASIPTAALPAGFNAVAIRTKDATGKWGLYESRGFYISSATANAANITAAEFFVDADPGVGNGTNITPITSGNIVNFTASISTAALAQGFHTIAIRIKDANGIWGLFENRGFYISAATGNSADITAAEYFTDADPGVGNGIPITPISNGSTVNFAATVPTAALTPGFHFLAIRTKDINGNWGLFENRGFYISSATGNAANITAAEFFTDTDPGVGNGTAITPITNGSTVNFTANVPTTSLAPGFHFLAIRTKDAAGNWGLYESRGFYITTQSANMPNMVAAEYFIDTDPGVGNATPVSIPASQTFTQALPLLVPGSTTQGNHFIAMRFKDANGIWGLFDFDTITVSGTIPVTGLTLVARKDQNRIALNWFTLTEINSSHFELERSKDGVQFEKTAQTPAAGNSNSRRDYAYTDAQPFANLNYYRIKQVDRDGRYTYSTMQLVRMNETKPFLVFPTVTSSSITISGAGATLQVKLYNAAKQLVKSEKVNTANALINMHSLPAGNYWLLIEKDGQVLHHQVIIKQ